MSKSTVRRRKEKKLASKMGMYNQYGGKSPSLKGHQYTKPGSGK